MIRWITGLLVVICTPLALAQELYVYPRDGQSKDQQDMDTYQCYQSARDQSGFDPMAAPRATSAEPEQKGGAVKGAAGGALAGLAIGAIAGDAGQGAAIGAAGGGLFGGMRRHQSNKERDQWEQQQTQAYAQNRNNYNRAYAACLDARGYTVR